MYDSRGRWMSHMKTEHSRHGWTCMDTDHASLHFEDEHLFRRHMLETHGDDMTEEELDDMADEFYGPLPTQAFFKDCPFCDGFDATGPRSIEEHIAEHLVIFSQISLSGHDLFVQGVEFASESGGSSSADHAESSVVSLDLTTSYRSHQHSIRPGAPQNYTYQYSQCTGRRKALLIGINYFGQRGQLRGCINDVRNMSSYLAEHFGYKREDMVILTDDQQNPMSQPTKQNILRAMHWLVKDARPNDSLFFHYSGEHRQLPLPPADDPV